MEKLEQQQKPEQRTGPEVMRAPEIVIREERGVQLFSALLKAENPAWGETEKPLAKETADYFQSHPLSSEILETIRSFQNEHVDEETLYNFALAYQHPERKAKVLEMVAKHKQHIKNSEEKYETFLAVLESFGQTFSASPLAEKFAVEIEGDKEERLRRLEATKIRIQGLIDFFKPDPKTADIKKVSFVPTDPLRRKNSGRAFTAFPGELIIVSHVDNTLNQDHEFSHGMINPIVEKLSERLTNEQKRKVGQLASEKLKQDYGGYFSVLCEEFIRTYTEVFSQGAKPQTYEDFVAETQSITEDEFQKYLAEDRGLKDWCEELGVLSIADFRSKARSYYERFEKNSLRDLIFRLYQGYANRHDKNKNFEQFIMETFPASLANV